MPAVLENVIVAAAPDPATATVRLTWANGSETVARFGHLAGKGVFAPLGDAEFFSKVRVGERGRTLTWPGEIDFCADALWFDAHPEDNPFARGKVATSG